MTIFVLKFDLLFNDDKTMMTLQYFLSIFQLGTVYDQTGHMIRYFSGISNITQFNFFLQTQTNAEKGMKMRRKSSNHFKPRGCIKKLKNRS